MKLMYSILIMLLFAGIVSCSPSEPFHENEIFEIVKKDSTVNSVLQKAEKYQVQIIYSQVDRDRNNKPSLRTYTLGLDTGEYFWPASTVKMPVAFLVLERLNELDIEGLSKFTTMMTDSAHRGQSRVVMDSTAEKGLPSVAHYIKKIFISSSNSAYNRLFEFLGPGYINHKLHEKGYGSSKIIQRLSVPLTPEQNRHTNAVYFLNNSDTLFKKEPAYSQWQYDTSQILLGNGEMTEGVLKMRPKDFGQKNGINLNDLHNILIAGVMPEFVDPKRRFNLKKEDYEFLYKTMSMLARESDYPSYDTATYYDSYVKFLMFGDRKSRIPSDIRIFNKVGVAYGYLTDVAYIVNFKEGVEFFLSAVIYVNENQIFNDGIYEYEEIGFPFLGALGRSIYEYELHRGSDFKPDLSRYKVMD